MVVDLDHISYMIRHIRPTLFMQIFHQLSVAIPRSDLYCVSSESIFDMNQILILF